MDQPACGKCFGPVLRDEGRASGGIECVDSGHRRVLGQWFQGIFHRGFESEVVNRQSAAGENDEEIGLTLAQFFFQKLLGDERVGIYILEATGLQPVDGAGPEYTRQQENRDTGCHSPVSVGVCVSPVSSKHLLPL